MKAIVSDALVTKGDVVVEIGPGAGALTQFLVEEAKHVYAFEIDTELKSELDQKFSNKSNIEIALENLERIGYNNKSAEQHRILNFWRGISNER